MPSLKDTLAENLKKILAEKKLTQDEFAEKVGLSFTTINMIANARAGLTGRTISKIATALDVEETDLTGIQKPAEHVELSKSDWLAIKNLLEMAEINGETLLIPKDILKRLSRLSESKRDIVIGVLDEEIAAIER